MTAEKKVDYHMLELYKTRRERDVNINVNLVIIWYKKKAIRLGLELNKKADKLFYLKN